MSVSCDDNFDNVLNDFLIDAGYDLCAFADEYSDGIRQLNSDSKYNLLSIVNGIKSVFLPSSWQTAFDAVLDNGLIVKCYPYESKKGIFIGGVNKFIELFAT